MNGGSGGHTGRKLLALRGVSKAFPGVQALADVSLELDAGEVVGLVGENGAGKSTLIKILGGIYTPDSGQILIDGRVVRIHSVRDAHRAGVSIIHQELNLADNLSIAENIFLGRQPFRAGWLGITHRRELYRRSAALLERVQLAVSPRVPVGWLSIGQKQLVEVAKALSLDARIVVFDEPTSSLSAREAEHLFEVIDRLRAEGVGIIYITHRLREVARLADRVVVLRDGKRVGELARGEFDHGRMVMMMVGRDVKQYYQVARHAQRPRAALEVRQLVYRRGTRPVSFTVQCGEIVGFAGLVGAGRTELARALFGVDPILAGSVRILGREVQINNPVQAIRQGLFLVPEERKTQGLVLEMPVAANISMACLSRLAPCGLMNRRAERELAGRQAQALSIRPCRLDRPVREYSGGNQQKIVLAKWLTMQPRVLILDEPTRGIDVGAKSEIYALISRLAEQGVGIMMISSEMEEIIALADRVIVMREGRITGEFTGPAITEQEIMKAALEGVI